MRAVVVAAIIAAIVLVVGLILLGLLGDFLVDWVWFAAIGYPGVFWTIIGTKSIVFLAAFGGSAAFLGLNGWLASRLSGRTRHVQPAVFDWRSVRGYTLPDVLRLLPRHPRWAVLAAAASGVLAVLIAAIEVSNWDVFLRLIYHVPYGRSGRDLLAVRGPRLHAAAPLDLAGGGRARLRSAGRVLRREGLVLRS
jgi:uncharacterized membrane protein (UPF0182 family)